MRKIQKPRKRRWKRPDFQKGGEYRRVPKRRRQPRRRRLEECLGGDIGDSNLGGDDNTRKQQPRRRTKDIGKKVTFKKEESAGECLGEATT